jgi:hypothetical protein
LNRSFSLMFSLSTSMEFCFLLWFENNRVKQTIPPLLFFVCLVNQGIFIFFW